MSFRSVFSSSFLRHQTKKGLSQPCHPRSFLWRLNLQPYVCKGYALSVAWGSSPTNIDFTILQRSMHICPPNWLDETKDVPTVLNAYIGRNALYAAPPLLYAQELVAIIKQRRRKACYTWPKLGSDEMQGHLNCDPRVLECPSIGYSSNSLFNIIL